ncbi:hypothetical protein LOC51_00655 [Rubrivivax sp. JA1024]|nr:hypothetical protein [Rubrivivax sp. JA1024]
MSSQTVRLSDRRKRSDWDVVARVGRPGSEVVISAPRGFENCPLVELTIRGEIHNLTPDEAERIGVALIDASAQAGAPE